MSLPLDAFLHSTLLVAVSEIGDKTQILSLILAARYRKSVPIVFGILVATLANHALAAFGGTLLMHTALKAWMPLILALSFIGLGLWILVPDKVDDDEGAVKKDYGAFVTTTIMFFLAEMGDKTQFATIALAAEYNNILMVVAGSTLGMMIANVPAVIFGDKIMKYVPLKWVRIVASLLFVVFGAWALWQYVTSVM
ncbi:TMEM165/GDT1 family protein [Asticcacaulis taihuensis]|uniref:TMEM165/GDT1 family protein n=1 Tax=Asticcacaulis taihuensis TaxID=260084 RepID=UPI0026ECC9AB|nr:TMEM165/GDT1 family protein [Asticcacaulis taihuensis]